MSTIDLRSDTVTLPTADMLRAMTSAPLGDDVFGEDPTVSQLEETAADRMGKEAALFVASGTMGNLLGLLVNARPGQEVIAEADSHVFRNEAAGAAMVGGIQIRQVPTERGVLSPAQVLAALAPPMMITSRCQRPSSSRTRITGTAELPGLSRTCGICPKPPAPTAWLCTWTAPGSLTHPSQQARMSGPSRGTPTRSRSACPRVCAARSAAYCAGQLGRSGKPDAGARCWAGVCGKPVS
jgi:Beta-eliminating lyase